MYYGMHRDRVRLSCVLFGCFLAHSATAATAVIDLAIDDPRPVSRAIDEFREFDPYPISYEDPVYAYSEDLRDVTLEASGSRADGRVIVPAGGTLHVRELPIPASEDQLRASADERRSIAEQALMRILEVQEKRTNGGRFAIEQSDHMLHVVPASVRNREGAWIQQTSILSHEITIAPGERNGFEMLTEICTALSTATGMKVGVGVGPLRSLYAAKSVHGASGESARNVLIRTLNQAGGRMTWKLFYAPDLQWYALNIVVLPGVDEDGERDQRSPARGNKLPGTK